MRFQIIVEAGRWIAMLLNIRTMQIQIIALVILVRPIRLVIPRATLLSRSNSLIRVFEIYSLVFVSFEQLILVKAGHRTVNLSILIRVLNCILLQRFLILRMWPGLLVN